MMKMSIALVAVALVLSAVIVDAQRGRGRGDQWVQIAQQAVNDRQDHDTAVVSAARGTFSAIRFEVRGHAVEFHRVVLHFANGDDQKLELRQNIPAGGQSRVIDIDGKERVIRSIDFWYDANTLRRNKGKATVHVLARR